MKLVADSNEEYKDNVILGKNLRGMLSDSKISKGGLIGAITGLFASLFIHKPTDTTGKKIIKTGSLGIIGYILGTFAEKKIKENKKL